MKKRTKAFVVYEGIIFEGMGYEDTYYEGINALAGGRGRQIPACAGQE